MKLSGYRMHRVDISKSGRPGEYSEPISAEKALPERENLVDHFPIKQIVITLEDGDRFYIQKKGPQNAGKTQKD